MKFLIHLFNTKACLVFGFLLVSTTCFSQSDDVQYELKDTVLIEKYLKETEKLIVSASYDSAFDQLEKAEQITKEIIGVENELYAKIIGLKGAIYTHKGDYSTAIEFMDAELALKLKIEGEESMNTAGAYNNLATVYYYKGDLGRAFEYFQKTLNLKLKVGGEDHSSLGKTYGSIGYIYSRRGEYHRALEYMQKGMAIDLKYLDGEDPELAYVYNNLAIVYNRLKEYEKAKEYYKKALDIQLINFGEENPNTAKTISNLGISSRKNRDYDDAIKYLQKALSIKIKLLNNNHPDVAMSYLEFGKVYIDIKKYNEAEQQFEKALSVLNYQDRSSLELINSIPALLRAQLFIGELYSNWYKNEGELKYLYKAKESYSSLDQTIQFQRANTASGSRYSLTSVFYPAYENAIQTNIYLHKETNEQEPLEDAFRYAEKTKFLSLFKTIQNEKALKHGGIPDSLLQKEKSIGEGIAIYNKERFKILNKGLSETDTAVLNVSNKLFELKQEQEELRGIFESDYPRYYDLKYDLAIASVEIIQEFLSDDQTALVEYFLGDTTLTVFGISKTEFVYDHQKIDSIFHKQMSSVREGLIPTFNQSDREATERFESYTRNSYSLYQTLLHPILQQLDGIEKLIIIPDGQLGYLPYETLLTQRAESDNYRSLPYLIRDYDIHYENSATLLLQTIDEKSTSPKLFAGYAPVYEGIDFYAQRDGYDSLKMSRSFPGLRDGILPLKFNQPEVANIVNTVGGNAYTGEMATESSFKQTAGDYQILHLAMHAFVNDIDPMYSHLVFAEETDSLEDRYLYAYELYNMQLDADMAVLSACETGVGRMKRGEGIMSLSRAFKYAGCPSIVTSLWKANDQSTKEIMTGFYKNLKNGMNKSEALRQAKLEFLDNAELPGMTHPTNWATFVLIGANEPISMGHGWGTYLMFGVIVLGIFFFLWRKRKINFKQ